MYNFLISQEQARQFAYECYDIIIQEIKERESEESERLQKGEAESEAVTDMIV